MEQQNKNRKSVVFAINYMDESLLEMAKGMIPNGYKIYSIPGDNGYYGQKFFMDLCSEVSEDYVINIDTDCFLVDHDAMWRVFDEFVACDYTLCGMPDGGVISHRCHNSLFINPFFSIWNLAAMREMNLWLVNNVTDTPRFMEKVPRWTLEDRMVNQPIYPRINIVYQDGLVPFSISNDFFEPYYAIQSAILNNGGSILYLNAEDAPEIDDDGACTRLYGLNNETIAFHAWFARLYSSNTYHFNRINKIYKDAKENCSTNIKGDS